MTKYLLIGNHASHSVARFVPIDLPAPILSVQQFRELAEKHNLSVDDGLAIVPIAAILPGRCIGYSGGQ